MGQGWDGGVPAWNAWSSYLGRGLNTMAGFEPTAVTNAAAGAEYWRFGTSQLASTSGMKIFGSPTQMGHPGLGHVGAFTGQGLGMWASSLANPGVLAFDLASGYSSGGVWGAKDALMWNVATNAAMASHQYSWAPGVGGVMEASQKSFLRSSVRNIGASVGATIGQSIGGTPGAFVGAYIGAQPLAALRAPGNALRSIGMGGVATMGSVGLGVGMAGAIGVGMAAATTLGPIYAAHKAAQFGAQYTANKRNINTAGDLGAFMTNNAMTMRGRAVQAIHKSHINGRSALGMEAGFMHTRKSYGSPYRQGWM